MKEATGELNMTVVTVVAIAAVGAFFYFFIWPGIQAGLSRNTCQNLCPGGELDSTQGRGGVDVNNKTCFCADGTTIEFGDETN
ncbi:unknown [Firmicutes bacterium CAG:460]|jgi:hypothetical protein|uniref:hypothetical protein n=1 Tax=Candidatus Onthocola sp. TaxID=3085646 RepID=UPI000335B9C5|nr:hypothetical protein [Bacillota bacterium]CDE49129.1 unknown [Firmicutes bacterium CAG:460]